MPEKDSRKEMASSAAAARSNPSLFLFDLQEFPHFYFLHDIDNFKKVRPIAL